MYYASCLGSSRRGEEPRKRRVSPVCCAGVELGLGKGGGGGVEEGRDPAAAGKQQEVFANGGVSS